MNGNSIFFPVSISSAGKRAVCYPTLYEINTWVWLSELSRKAGKYQPKDPKVPAMPCAAEASA